MNTRYSKHSGKRVTRLTKAIACALGLSVTTLPAFAGSIFISGHDPDFHASAGHNAAGAQNLINLSLAFARDGSTLPVLFLQSNTSNVLLGDHVDSEQGLLNSGYSAAATPGTHYVMLDANSFATADLSLYSALFLPSDHGGTLTEDDLLAVNARSDDLITYLNAGGGLVAFAEDGFHAGRLVSGGAPLFGFLPFLVSSASLDQGESGFTVTPFGASLGLTVSDINGNFSHNIFTSTGGMDVVDRDGDGNIVSLAYRGEIGRVGAVPVPAAIWLLGPVLGGLGLMRRRSP